MAEVLQGQRGSSSVGLLCRQREPRNDETLHPPRPHDSCNYGRVISYHRGQSENQGTTQSETQSNQTKPCRRSGYNSRRKGPRKNQETQRGPQSLLVEPLQRHAKEKRPQATKSETTAERSQQKKEMKGK